MPSMEGYITIKMKSGYNAGFSKDKVRITLLENNGNGEKGNGGNGGQKSQTAVEDLAVWKKAPKNCNSFNRRNNCQQNRLPDRRSYFPVYC